MQKIRTINTILTGQETMEGAGVRLNRIFGHPQQAAMFDPYLLLDDFHSSDPRDYIKGFPWHPHRGIETITYVLEGRVEHGDSLGNKGVIGPGDVQWMTSGSGIIHQEMPSGNAEGRMGGLQLWANIPAAHKMCTPRYQEIPQQQIPVVHLPEKGTAKIIAGTLDDVRGPVQNEFIDPVYLDIALPAASEFVYPTLQDHTFFVYILDGSGLFGLPGAEYTSFDGGSSAVNANELQQAAKGKVVVYDRGSMISIATADTPVRFLLIGGRPLREPVAWYGPIVMNTKEQLKTAFEEFQVGTFLKHDVPKQKRQS